MFRHLILALFLVLFVPGLASAQISATGISESSSIVLEPAYPEPQSTFTAKVNDYSLAAPTNSIVWRVNGEVVPDSNTRNITLEAGRAGERMLIEAFLVQAEDQAVTLTKNLTPVYLDIVAEPQTRTPAFYQGRSLPSIGSQVNLRAILNGLNIPAQDLMYSWSVNNSFVNGGPLRGLNSSSVTVPRGNAFLVSLSISNLNGTELVRRDIYLPSVKPEVHFYEKTALYGLDNKSLNSFNLISNSATLVAEPYYLDLQTYNQPSLLEWEVDNKEQISNSNNPYEITLGRPTGVGSGRSQLDFHVRNLAELLQGTRGDLRVNF